MKISLLTLSAILLFTCSLETHAARRDNRQANQGARIREGVKSGELTHREAKRLRKEQRAINRTERRMEADGEVTTREKARLERMQDRACKDIYRQKHYQQERGNGSEAPASGGAAE
jgi:polyhydroxyalkanoate synthesis regulator phasin